ncbi:MAG: tRNA (adenosine(37)-N6)-threonylcarbamoyltransferase complex ATPase subunit type 1 TsaE [Cypionkella sp.]|nr:tRNA (adenosine(37)-N6)-threonylcarbamoyltransferase complex ATPase subunit type 1 TsaE [Cypionkella sp.]
MSSRPTLSANSAQDLRPFLADHASTALMAQVFAQHLGAGATVLLSGPVGAGKSHFARALIRAYLGPDVEVPSPSFTLVQCYEAGEFEIWHADLYRLSNAGEVAELGLYDAMGRDLCLIEWPDRLADLPKDSIHITLAYEGEGRRARISGASKSLQAALSSTFLT